MARDEASAPAPPEAGGARRWLLDSRRFTIALAFVVGVFGLVVTFAWWPEPSEPVAEAAPPVVDDPPEPEPAPVEEEKVDARSIARCCMALRQNANSAPPEQRAMYLSAAAVCDSVKSNPQGVAALAQVRGLLMGGVPKACR